MFSEMMRMRPACARKPEAAIVSVLIKSTVPSSRLSRSALAERSLDEIEATRVERRRCLEIHLVGRNLHHLFLEVHGIARWPNLEGARISVSVSWLAQADALDVTIRRARERNGRHGAGQSKRRIVKFERCQVVRPEFGRIGICDIFGQNPLAGLSPVESRSEHG